MIPVNNQREDVNYILNDVQNDTRHVYLPAVDTCPSRTIPLCISRCLLHLFFCMGFFICNFMPKYVFFTRNLIVSELTT